MATNFSADCIPDIPGQALDLNFERILREEVGELLGCAANKFPGAQPVSFTLEHIQELKENDYFVCEKSDGVRCLLYTRVNKDTRRPETFLIDRKNKYFFLHDIQIPSALPENAGGYQHKTLIDGELVIDTERDGRKLTKYLAFDLLACEGKVMINRAFGKRQGYLRDFVVKPFLSRALYYRNLEKLSIIIEAKVMEFSYGMMKILKEQVPRLKHKSDGLIFTSLEAPYTLGTCETMLKWKPPNENSVDFKLNLQFISASEPPKFLLSIWKGNNDYEQVDEMGVTSKELKHFKTLFGNDLKRLNDKIVEVTYDPTNCPPHKWKFMRFRDDKLHANHYSILEKIKKSISDNIDEKRLEEEHLDIRSKYKERQNRPPVQPTLPTKIEATNSNSISPPAK